MIPAAEKVTIHVPETQRGIALAMALVVLVILTILGVSAMKSSTLEIKMAVGIQDNTMAFQAAESGLVEAFRNVTLDPNQTVTTTYTPVPGSGVVATTATTFTEYSNLQNSDKPSSKVNYRQANFTQTATATTPGGAKVIINQGVRQIINN
jgi:Tfp pilus assembly protein PilX